MSLSINSMGVTQAQLQSTHSLRESIPPQQPDSVSFGAKLDADKVKDAANAVKKTGVFKKVAEGFMKVVKFFAKLFDSIFSLIKTKFSGKAKQAAVNTLPVHNFDHDFGSKLPSGLINHFQDIKPI